MQRLGAHPHTARRGRPHAEGLRRGGIRRGRWAVALLALVTAGCPRTPVPDPAVRYVAFGDSTTAGAAERDYHDILREMLGEPPETFANQGSGGESAELGLERLRQLIDRELYPNAHTLFYWQGGAGVIAFIAEVDPFLLMAPDAPGYPHTDRLADLLEAIQGQIEDAIEAGHGAGWRVYVATYYPMPTWPTRCDPMWLEIMLPGQARNANTYRRMLNTHIRRAAARQTAVLVDVAAIEALGTDPAHYADCNHLSTEGNGLVAERFLEAFRQATEVQ